MSNNKIQIIIAGAAGAGKTTIAQIILRAIELTGLETDITTDEPVLGALMEGSVPINDLCEMRDLYHRKVVALRNKATHVCVSTLQTCRTAPVDLRLRDLALAYFIAGDGGATPSEELVERFNRFWTRLGMAACPEMFQTFHDPIREFHKDGRDNTALPDVWMLPEPDEPDEHERLTAPEEPCCPNHGANDHEHPRPQAGS